MSERWLPVTGWEGWYWVSDQGRVRSEDRIINCGFRGQRPVSGRVLSPYPRPSGHLTVDLRAPNHPRRAVDVHRLVLEAFIGPCPVGMESLHWDDDPTNNALTNLRYGTRSENLRDAVRNKRHWQSKKTHCKRGHELAGANLIQRTDGRECRTCSALHKRNYEARQKANEPRSA